MSGDARTVLGRQIAGRWGRSGQAGRARMGLVATSSRRFVTGIGRGGLVRRAYAGSAVAPVARSRDLAVSPPRWWREARLLAGPELAGPEPSGSGQMPDTPPSRGLARAVRPMPGAAPGRPQGTLMTSPPKTVPMRLPSEVRAVGQLTTPADTAARRLHRGREPGPSGGADSKPSEPALAAGGRAPGARPRATTTPLPANRTRHMADRPATADRSGPVLPDGVSALGGPHPAAPSPIQSPARLAPRLARRRAAAAAAVSRTERHRPAASRREETREAIGTTRPATTSRGTPPTVDGETAALPSSAERRSLRRMSTEGAADLASTERATVVEAHIEARPDHAAGVGGSGFDNPGFDSPGFDRINRHPAAETGPRQPDPTPLPTALHRIWRSTARLVRADPLTQAPRPLPGRTTAGTASAVPRLSVTRVRPTGGWPGALRRLPAEATGVQAAAVRTPGTRTPGTHTAGAQVPGRQPAQDTTGDPAPGRPGHDRPTPTTIPSSEPSSGPSSGQAAQPGERMASADPGRLRRAAAIAGPRPPALIRRLDTTPAARLPGATGRHWQPAPATARRLPRLGIESPDLLGAALAEEPRSESRPAAGPTRRGASPTAARVLPRHAGRRARQPEAAGVHRSGPATRSAHRFAWLVSVDAATEIATPTRGLPDVSAALPVLAGPVTSTATGRHTAGQHGHRPPPAPATARRLTAQTSEQPSAPRSIQERSAPPVPAVARGLSGPEQARTAATRQPFGAGPAFPPAVLTALAGGKAGVAPPRTVIRRMPDPATAPERSAPPPGHATTPMAGTPGVTSPIVRRWTAPTPSGAAMHGTGSNTAFRLLDDGPSQAGETGRPAGDQPGGELSAGILARLDERIRSQVAQEFDTELTDRVHRIIDERLSAELERQAWRRGAGGF